MAATVKYTGPSPEIEIPTLRLTCKHGDSIQVEADVAASLVASGDWERSSTKVQKAAQDIAETQATPDASPASPAPTKTEES